MYIQRDKLYKSKCEITTENGNFSEGRQFNGEKWRKVLNLPSLIFPSIVLRNLEEIPIKLLK